MFPWQRKQTLDSLSASGIRTLRHHQRLSAMALRSLVFKMKAVPRGVPASRAFATTRRKPDPKLMNDRWSKIVEELGDTSKYRSREDRGRAIGALIAKQMKPISERLPREIVNLRGAIAGLFMVGGLLIITHK